VGFESSAAFFDTFVLAWLGEKKKMSLVVKLSLKKRPSENSVNPESISITSERTLSSASSASSDDVVTRDDESGSAKKKQNIEKVYDSKSSSPLAKKSKTATPQAHGQVCYYSALIVFFFMF